MLRSELLSLLATPVATLTESSRVRIQQNGSLHARRGTFTRRWLLSTHNSALCSFTTTKNSEGFLRENTYSLRRRLTISVKQRMVYTRVPKENNNSCNGDLHYFIFPRKGLLKKEFIWQQISTLCNLMV